jgi:hypothetical protein
MSKPTHGSVRESVEVLWEAVHQWAADLQSDEPDNREPSEDDVKLSMNIIMDRLNLEFDMDGSLIDRVKK